MSHSNNLNKKIRAVKIDTILARKYFSKHGNHSEVKLNELQLSALLSIAAEEALEISNIVPS